MESCLLVCNAAGFYKTAHLGNTECIAPFFTVTVFTVPLTLLGSLVGFLYLCVTDFISAEREVNLFHLKSHSLTSYLAENYKINKIKFNLSLNVNQTDTFMLYE